MKAEEAQEIAKHLKEYMDFFIPNATQNEQNYYLRGVIDALMFVEKSE